MRGRILFVWVTVVLAGGSTFAQQAAPPELPASPVTASASASTPAATAINRSVAATVQQPRPFGYVIGDLLTQRVLLESQGHAFEPASLLADGRVGAWFERRSSRIETRADGRRWLAVEYQVINAPLALMSIRLPAWELKAKSDGEVLRIPAWDVSVSPLTAPAAPGASSGDATADAAVAAESRASAGSSPAGPQGEQTGANSQVNGNGVHLRPDQPAPVIPTAATKRRLALWLAVTLITLASWLGWLLWRNHLTASNQPFAKAYREIRHADDNAPEAWQSLHRAFDRTAGRVVQPESLHELFSRAPYLQPLRAQIERFYIQSSDKFFGNVRLGAAAESTDAARATAAAGSSVAADIVSPRALSNDLRRLEKRHER
ncbi:MAG: hypothetical protein ABI885_16125 [Gammaproteobacteria bacterium]